MSEINYEIVKPIGVLSKNEKGWTKEVNIIKWNNGEPKYDIRSWSPDKEKMGKGISFTEDELRELFELLGFSLGEIKADTLNFDKKEDNSEEEDNDFISFYNECMNSSLFSERQKKVINDTLCSQLNLCKTFRLRHK